MAGVFKRPPAVTGLPAVPTPANASLPALQQAINNIRARLEKLDAAVNRSYTTLDASSPQKALESLQSQIAVLSKDLENLTAQVGVFANSRQPTYLAMQMGDDGDDGMAGPPGPPGPPGSPGHLAVQGCDNCGGDEYNIVIQQTAAGPSGDFFLWDEAGQVLLTEDGNAILTE